MHSYYPEQMGFDLREDLHRLLHGDYNGVGIGRPVILRQVTDTPCVCFNTKTDPGNPHCHYCQGEGYQFREKLVERAYIARSFGSVLGGSTQISQQSAVASYGITDPHKAVAYVEWNVYQDYGRYVEAENKVPDKLYELEVDSSGGRVHPLHRVAKWKVKSVVPHHGDNGRVELIELGLEKENV